MFLCVLQIRERRKQAYKQVYKAMVETEMRVGPGGSAEIGEVAGSGSRGLCKR